MVRCFRRLGHSRRQPLTSLLIWRAVDLEGFSILIWERTFNFGSFLPRYQPHIHRYDYLLAYCVIAYYNALLRFLYIDTYVRYFIYEYISRRAVKLQTLSFGLCGKDTPSFRMNLSFFSLNACLLTALCPYARHAQPFHPSRMAFHFHCGHEYLGCYALPLLRTNAHIFRLPFEL